MSDIRRYLSPIYRGDRAFLAGMALFGVACIQGGRVVFKRILGNEFRKTKSKLLLKSAEESKSPEGKKSPSGAPPAASSIYPNLQGLGYSKPHESASASASAPPLVDDKKLDVGPSFMEILEEARVESFSAIGKMAIPATIVVFPSAAIILVFWGAGAIAAKGVHALCKYARDNLTMSQNRVKLIKSK